MKTARITGTGSYLPKKVLTNFDLYKKQKIKKFFNIKEAKEKLQKNLSKEEINKLNKLKNPEIFDAWTIQVTGIKQRHIYTNDFNKDPDFIGPVENMGAEAAKKALQAAQINPQDLDFIIAATFTQEQTIPNPACSIGHLIGADGIPGTHINNACAGFIYGLIQAQKEIQRGAKNVLVVASEYLTKVTGYQDIRTAVLFGDGAGAAVLTADETGILGYSRKSQYEDKHVKLKKIRGKEKLVEISGGPQVLANAVRAMSTQTKKALKNANLTLDDIKYIIPHQANGRITRGLAKNLNIPLEKICNIIKDIGNTSGSSIPIALDKLVRGELPGYKIKKGDNLVLTAIGIGYTMGAVVMEMREMRAAT